MSTTEAVTIFAAYVLAGIASAGYLVATAPDDAVEAYSAGSIGVKIRTWLFFVFAWPGLLVARWVKSGSDPDDALDALDNDREYVREHLRDMYDTELRTLIHASEVLVDEASEILKNRIEED